MKIVHLIWSLGYGGIESMIIELINEQSKENDIDLIIINNKTLSDDINKTSEKVKIHFIGRKVRSKNPYYFIKLNFLLYQLKPDCIHCHIENQIRILFKWLLPPIYLTVHDVNKSIDNLSSYDKLFSISKAVYDDLIQRGNIKSVIIHNGIKTSLFRKKVFKASEHLRIVQISRLEHAKKGQDILIKAARILIDRYSINSFHISFIGEGSSLEYLKSLVQELSLEDKIEFLGSKNRDYIYNHLRDYDLLVQPSRYEGFGITVIEAMITGIPVLASNIEGPAEIIDQGKYGYLFDNENPDSCAATMYAMHNDIQSGKVKKKLDSAMRYASEYYDVSRTSQLYLFNYSK